VIFLLPVILALLILGALRGGTNMVLVLPMLLFLAGGVVAMTIANRDIKKRSRTVHVLPTDHLSRKMRSALGVQRPSRPSGKPRSLSTRGPWRRSGPRRLPDDAA
jgi:hypothetical protein